MSSELAAVLEAISKLPAGQASPADAQQRLAAVQPNLVPKRALLTGSKLTEAFCERVSDSGATLAKAASFGSVPEHVANYLGANDLGDEIYVAPDPAISKIKWAASARLTLRSGAVPGDGAVAVTACLFGIAETGTLVLTSECCALSSFAFLPAHHIAILTEAQIVGPYEAVWAKLREGGLPLQMPRALCFITGPSRTGDIEQQILLGAHGPKTLHVILVEASE